MDFTKKWSPSFCNFLGKCRTEGHLLDSQSFASLDADLQDLFSDLHIFLLTAGGLMPQMFVAGAAVDSEHPAGDGDGMLARQGANGSSDPPAMMNIKKIQRLIRKYGLKCPVRKANPYRRMVSNSKRPQPHPRQSK